MTEASPTPATTDAVTFYSTKDGGSYSTSDPSEITRMRMSRGYSETKNIPVEIDQRFDPGKHSVAEVIEYLSANPERYDDVVAAERKGQARKGIVGE